MTIAPELWIAAIYGAILLLAGAGKYLSRQTTPPAKTNDAVLAGIGLGFGEREQMDRLIAEVKRIADALTDKNTSGINHRLDELLERIDEAERRGHTQKPRPPR